MCKLIYLGPRSPNAKPRKCGLSNLYSLRKPSVFFPSYLIISNVYFFMDWISLIIHKPLNFLAIFSTSRRTYTIESRMSVIRSLLIPGIRPVWKPSTFVPASLFKPYKSLFFCTSSGSYLQPSSKYLPLNEFSKPQRFSSIISHPSSLRCFHTSRVNKAEFWKVGTNIKIFRGMLKENGSSQWKYRLVLFLCLFTVLNFLFNVMLTVLTNIYLEKIQESCWDYGFSVNSDFKTGLVNETIRLNETAANLDYFNCIKALAKDNGVFLYDIDDNSQIKDINDILMDVEELDVWYAKRNIKYISVYCDLLLRYALTSDEKNYEEVNKVINRAFSLIEHYEKKSQKEVSTYSLKNKALRIQAEMMKYNNQPFEEVEKVYYDSIRLVISHEFKSEHLDSKDIAIIPADEFSSNSLTNTLLDLCSFYTETREPALMKKSLTILLSELRSLENEFNLLDSKFNAAEVFNRQTSNLSNKNEKRLMELRFEKIPLINLQISELLWSQKNYSKAIELAKDSAQVSSMYAAFNFNSAKIAKMGFMNLSTMFKHVNDIEGSELCIQRSKEIEIPLDAFAATPGNTRDVVLEYWFGAWGKFLFPG